MFPHRSLLLAILRLPFSALRCQRELSKEQYALEAAAKGAYCFELNSLWHQSAEIGNQRIARIKDRWGISFYVFYLLRLLFHLIMETFFLFFFTVHGNPVSSSFLQIRKSFCLFFGIRLNKKRMNFLLLRFVPDSGTNLRSKKFIRF